jgi:hypothetical protein
MVESALRYIEMAESEGYRNIIVSLKSSDVLVAVEAYRLFAKLADYPTHIGITEAGKPPYAVTKSAAGLAPILLDGIGDTIRVSLLGDPIPEIAACFDILQATQRRVRRPELIACPTCGRLAIDLEKIIAELEAKLDGKRLYAQARRARSGASIGPGADDRADDHASPPQAPDEAHADAAIEAATAQKTRTVHIAAIDVVSLRLRSPDDPPGTLPEVSFRVRCGKGTYIRSLARDLGDALGVGAHLSSLRRLRVGPFDLQNAVAPDQAAAAKCYGLRDAVAHLPQLVLNDTEAHRLRCGQPAVLRELAPRLSALRSAREKAGVQAVAALDLRGALIAIVQPVEPSPVAGREIDSIDRHESPQRWQIARGFSEPIAAPAQPTKEAPCTTDCA